MESHRKSSHPLLKSGEVFHLPVAPRTVARTRYSPPLSSLPACLMPVEGLRLLDSAMAENKSRYSMVAISGPGDPLATPDTTLEAIRLVREKYPQLTIGLRTMGLGSEALAAKLAEAGVSYIEMNIEAVRKEVLEKLFAWIRPGSKTLKLSEGATVLLDEQRSGVSALTFHGIHVSINTTLYPGYNMDHVGKISEEMLELGARSISISAYTPQPGVEVDLEPPPEEAIKSAMEKAQAHLPLVPAILTFSPPETHTIAGPQVLIPKPTADRPNLAVTSTSGMEVDLHLGHATRFIIYGRRPDGLCCLLEMRHAPAPGSGNNRWEEVAETLSDCFLLITASAGESPRKVLSDKGMQVYITDENIEGLVDAIYNGNKKKKHK